MEIRKGRLIGVPFKLARYDTGKPLKPTAIILHETAGPLDKGNCVTYFQSKACAARKVNCHLVIDRDGTVTQMVDLNRRANHAGASAWKGRQFCNSFTIGIELVGPGKLDPKGRAWFQKSGGFNLADCCETPKEFIKSHTKGYWLPYTPEQIKATKEVCRAIMEEYPDCNDIITHYMVSPGRKVDVNPTFPLEEVRRYAEGLDDPPDEPLKSDPIPNPPAIAAPATPVEPAVQSGPAPVMTLAEVTSASRHLGMVAKARSYLKWLVGGGAVALTIDVYNYAMGVYNELSQVIIDKAPLLIGIVGGLAGVYLLSRALSGGQVAVQEGRYIPSGAVGAGPPLAGPRGDDLAGA